VDDNNVISEDAKTVMQTVAMAFKFYKAAGFNEIYAFELAKDFQHELLIAEAFDELTTFEGDESELDDL
jgi:hypothetical protein